MKGEKCARVRVVLIYRRSSLNTQVPSPKSPIDKIQDTIVNQAHRVSNRAAKKERFKREKLSRKEMRRV